MILTFMRKYRHVGLLILRVGIGAMFIMYGKSKMFDGPDTWKALGGTMKLFGITVYPVAWGFAAAFSEFVGGFLLILGLFTRPIVILMLGTMVVAATKHIMTPDEGFKAAMHAIEMGTVFLSIFFIGPGKYSVDKLIQKNENQF